MKRSPRTAPQCAATNTLGIRCGHNALPGLSTCRFHSTEQEQALSLSIREANRDRLRAQPTEFPVANAEEFAKAVLESWEFREYIADGLLNRTIPPTILVRLMDYAEGWGKPPERIEHTGKDGEAIVTEVRRVIIQAPQEPPIESEDFSTLPVSRRLN